MALAVLGLATTTKEGAAASITDGFDDDGIDCIYADKQMRRLYLGQSKWFSNTKKGVQLGDFTRFRDGVARLIDLKFDDQNADLHGHREAVKDALDDINCEIHLVFAHNSEQPLSDEICTYRDEFLAECNKFESIMHFNEVNLAQAGETARSQVRPENIDVEALLRNWGRRKNPFKAVYGSMSAADVVDWYEENGKRLFAENLRYAIERSDVNEGISRTAKFTPENFWYYNNGITAICDDFEKNRIGGNDTDSGLFTIKKISIINGAQTVSSLFKAKAAGADLSQITIQMRVISLAGTPEGFSIDVTTANNTQNDLNPVDFVAADDNQDRIRREAASFGVVYTFRRGDDEPIDADGFGIRDATVAAACASGDLKLAVSAKRYISGLWENTAKEPYTRLFNNHTSAWWLWNAVRVSRAVDGALTELAEISDGREHLVAVHSNRFVLYLTFKNIDFQLKTDAAQPNEDIAKAVALAQSILGAVTKIVADGYPDAYPGNVFKNTERQSEIEALFNQANAESAPSEAPAADLIAMMTASAKASDD
ncbi:AIPR family protein [Erythrobacter sp. GH1-10]|uniref:AIPR family protein n=1 Tax=Erythrobacter sp. GH1-10 TaxID=3349334 RepID=UPI0038781240